MLPLSAIALAVALIAVHQPARAANECGAEVAGQDTLTCAGASYATGISYSGSNGLTLDLANPAMVVTGAQGVSLQTNIGPVAPELTVNVTSVDSITATGSAVTVATTATGGVASVNIASGAITTTGVAATVSANGGAAAADARVTLSGGRVLNSGNGVGILASTAGVNGTGNASIVITGGEVQATSLAVQANISGAGHTGTSSIAMSGGSVVSSSLIALWARTAGKGLAQVQVTGGTVLGGTDGIFASSTFGSFAVDVLGGTVTGGGGAGAAVHFSGGAGGTANIGAAAVINAGASGVALRDGDLNRDGIDEVGDNATITTAGMLNGSVLLGGGTDTLNVAGGSINGNITGDGLDALNFNLGSNSFTYGAAHAISGMNSIAMNSGTAQIDSAINGGTALAVNGGTMVLTGDNSYTGGTTIHGGFLQLGNGGTSGSIVGDVVDNATLAFNRSDVVTFGGLISGTGAVTHAGPGTTVLTAANSYTGATTIASGTLALAGAGSIAASSGVVADGTFDISGVGAGGSSIRRLSGNGTVMLGGKTLTLTAAADNFGGAIAGTGSFALAAGKQVLTGTNTYTGGTTISGGTLQLGNGGTSGSILGDITNSGTLVFNRSNRMDVDGTILGAGAIRQIGAGLTNLGGNSAAFAGITTVEAGTLAVNGALGGTLSVLGAGRVQGSGTVGSTTVAGTVAPGNSIGTLTVNGNFTQAAGSTYQVEVDPASNASDLLHASGTAGIASGANLQVLRTAGSGYGLGNRYTVLTADGGVTGTYSLTGDTQTAFVRLFDSYDATHVYLNTEKVRSFTEVATSPNQAAVATALESLPETNGLVNAVAFLPSDFAARDAFDQLSVDIHASSKTAALEDSRFVREAAIDRLRTASCAPGSASPAQQLQQQQQPQQAGAGCTPADNQARSTWGQVSGSWGHIDGNGNAAKLKRDIGGFVVGADTGVGEGWRVGGLAGYSRASADTDARNSSARTDSYHLGVYGSSQWGATALRLGASQSWNKLDTSRSVAFAGFADSVSASYDSTTSQLFGEVGHRIDAGTVALEPFAGLAHVRVKSDAFFERGGLAALYGDGGSVDATFSTLGVRASTQLSERTRVRGLLGWRHAFGETTPTSTHAFGGSLPFTLAGVPLAKNVAVLEAGVETQLRPNLSLGASYSGQFGDGLKDHGFKVNLNWAF